MRRVHDGNRQFGHFWRAAVSSLLALISEELSSTHGFACTLYIQPASQLAPTCFSMSVLLCAQIYVSYEEIYEIPNIKKAHSLQSGESLGLRANTVELL